MNAFWYVLGSASCVVWRWLRWLGAQPAGTKPIAFIRARGATNGASLIVSLIMMGAYLSGAMGNVIRSMMPAELEAKIPPIYAEAWAAPIVGFAITFGARVLVKRFAEKIGEKDDE